MTQQAVNPRWAGIAPLFFNLQLIWHYTVSDTHRDRVDDQKALEQSRGKSTGKAEVCIRPSLLGGPAWDSAFLPQVDTGEPPIHHQEESPTNRFLRTDTNPHF